MTLNSSRESICQSFQKQTAKRLSILKVIRVKMTNLCRQPIFMGEQIAALYEQFKRYFAINELVYIGIDSFIYYSEGDITKCVAPDIHIVFGVAKYPLRRSFYTWAEGTAPVAVFEFLSDATGASRSE